MSLGAGEALAAGGLAIAAVTMLHEVGPGFDTALRADVDDHGVRGHLTAAELATATTIAGAAVLAAVLMRASWPLYVAAAAIALAVVTHELALRAGA